MTTETVEANPSNGVSTSKSKKHTPSRLDLFPEAVRKVMAADLRKAGRKQKLVFKSDDADAVHDMRVAARRIRSALEVFGFAYKQKCTSQYYRGVRTVARRLGSVRDLDVFRINLNTYMETLGEDAGDMKPLTASVAKEHKNVRGRLIDHLHSKPFQKFRRSFQKFVDTSGRCVRKADDDKPRRVFEILPGLLHVQLGRVTAYGPELETVDVQHLHQLRIEVKRLRYMVEFFENLLGPGAPGVIAILKALQDSLGEWRDAGVARERVWAVLEKQYRRDGAAFDTSAKGVELYLAHLGREQERLRAAIEGPWQPVRDGTLQRELGHSVAVV